MQYKENTGIIAIHKRWIIFALPSICVHSICKQELLKINGDRSHSFSPFHPSTYSLFCSHLMLTLQTQIVV